MTKFSTSTLVILFSRSKLIRYYLCLGMQGAVNFALMMSQMEGGCPVDYNTITDLFLQVCWGVYFYQHATFCYKKQVLTLYSPGFALCLSLFPIYFGINLSSSPVYILD